MYIYITQSELSYLHKSSQFLWYSSAWSQGPNHSSRCCHLFALAATGTSRNVAASSCGWAIPAVPHTIYHVIAYDIIGKLIPRNHGFMQKLSKIPHIGDHGFWGCLIILGGWDCLWYHLCHQWCPFSADPKKRGTWRRLPLQGTELLRSAWTGCHGLVS